MPGANLGGRAAACRARVPGGGERTSPALASTIREPGPGPASVHTPGQDGLSHRTGFLELAQGGAAARASGRAKAWVTCLQPSPSPRGDARPSRRRQCPVLC